MIIVTAAALGFLAQQGALRSSSLGITLPLCLLGGFGAVASAKYGERWAVHSGLADALRHEISLLHPGLNLPELIAANAAEHAEEFPRVLRLKIRVIWVVLHSAIAVTGLVLSLWIMITRS